MKVQFFLQQQHCTVNYSKGYGTPKTNNTIIPVVTFKSLVVNFLSFPIFLVISLGILIAAISACVDVDGFS
jgi:hypothetical protein